jgi:hypothetical protein
MTSATAVVRGWGANMASAHNTSYPVLRAAPSRETGVIQRETLKVLLH